MTLAARAHRPAIPARHALIVDLETVPIERHSLVPRYGDDRWSLLSLTQNPSAAEGIIYWTWFPDAYREMFRHATWALINLPLPDGSAAGHGMAMRSRLSAGRIFKTVKTWAAFAAWLCQRGVGSLSEVSTDDLTAFATSLITPGGLARNTACSHPIALSRLHYYSTAYLPAGERMTEPLWIREGHDDYLPAASNSGENLTEPLTPATMGPLLVWALRFVEQFADDILAAHKERRRIDAAADVADAAPDTGDGNVLTYLRRARAANAPIPAMTGRHDERPWAAVVFLAGITGTPTRHVRRILQQPQWRDYLQHHATPALLNTAISTTLDGRPWREPFTYYGRDTMVKELTTACFIVIAYLTGMRTGEVLGLQAGCCPQPQAEPGVTRQLIYAPTLDDAGPATSPPRHELVHGRQFKNSRDEHGNHTSAGADRVPWVAVPPVVKAVRVLEGLTGGTGLLFGATVHDQRSPDIRAGRSLSPVTFTNRIKAFVTWVNHYARSRGRGSEIIPPDVHGSIGPARFRRTLAWHIARRPGGLVALAVQYGHLRTLVSEGYASRSRSGLHDLLDLETARAVAEDLTDLHDALENGAGVSGPAARRLIHAASARQHRFGGMVTTLRQARTLLADPALNVFHNREAFLFCNYDRTKALCHPGRSGDDQAPSLDRCRSNCANIARTDKHADQIETVLADLRVQADSPLLPEPLADRLREKAGELASQAQRHRATRLTTDQEKP